MVRGDMTCNRLVHRIPVIRLKLGIMLDPRIGGQEYPGGALIVRGSRSSPGVEELRTHLEVKGRDLGMHTVGPSNHRKSYPRGEVWPLSSVIVLTDRVWGLGKRGNGVRLNRAGSGRSPYIIRVRMSRRMGDLGWFRFGV